MLPAAALGVAVLLPLAVLMGTVLLLGWQLQVIETASMEPRLPAGSLAVIEPLDAADVRAGMTIAFEDPAGRGRLVAHRAVKRLPGDLPVWQTKGDANAEADPFPVHAAAIRGRVRWAIPRLGSIASALHTPATVVALVGVPLALLATTEVITFRRRRRAQTAELGNALALPHDHHLRLYAIRDPSSSHNDPLRAYLDVFLRREDAERFVDDVRRDEPVLADALEIVEHKLEAARQGTTK